MNVGNPELAFDFQRLPNAGIGLARLEFIIARMIGIHPQAVLSYPNVPPDLRREIEARAAVIPSPKAFYLDKLTEGIATLGAAFAPKPVIVRLSDFKSNEYSTPARRAALRAARREPDARLPRRLALHRSQLQGVLRAGMHGAQARARRHGPHQRRDHGAVRAHA